MAYTRKTQIKPLIIEKPAAPLLCECGKTVVSFSALLGLGFCADEACYNRALKSKDAIESAHIKLNKKTGEAYFQQGHIGFAVDGKDLNKVVGCNGESCVLDRLMDSQITSLAMANSLPVKPYVYELLKRPLLGIIQLVWYRDVEGRHSEHLELAQSEKVSTYLRKLREFREAPTAPSAAPAKARSSKSSTDWSRSFKIAPGKRTGICSGRENDLLAVIAELKQANLAKIVEASKGRVKTTQPLDKIVQRFVKELLSKNAIVEV